jgi:dienelactone hydrolase
MSTRAARQRRPRTVLGLLLGLASALTFAVAPVQAQTRMVYPSADGPRNEPVMLRGLLFRAPAVVGLARAAVVILPDCHGAWQDEGATQAAPALHALAQSLNAAGLHALVVDSLRPRGVREICSDTIAARTVRPRHLRSDALASLEFLARQVGVDPQRLGLLGVGRGGTAVIAAVNRAHADVRRAVRAARAAAALAPDCAAEPAAAFETQADLGLPMADARGGACEGLVQALTAAGPGRGEGASVTLFPGQGGDAVEFLRRHLADEGTSAGTQGADPAGVSRGS